MIVKNAWYVAAWGDEITDQPIARRICNEPVVLYRTKEGKAVALQDSCSHRGAPLSLGTVVDKGIRCNYHGLIFGCDGACVEVPNQEVIPKKARVASYPLVEKDQMLWIWHGDPERADESMIPDYPFHNDSKNWPHIHDMMPVKCHYLMLVDNLLDATHLAYVHPDSVGGSSPSVHMVAKNSLDATDNGIKLSRQMSNAPAPPVYNNCVPFPGMIDRWQDFEFIAPAFVIQYSGGVQTGEDRKTAGAPRFDMRIWHALTPETDNSCFYFWSTANGHETDNPAATDKIDSEIRTALAEDKVMVEAQQERIDEFGEDWLVDNKADAPRVMARRAVTKLQARQNPDS